MKQCSLCKRDLPESSFGKKTANKDKLQSMCKECDHDSYQRKKASQTPEEKERDKVRNRDNKRSQRETPERRERINEIQRLSWRKRYYSSPEMKAHMASQSKASEARTLSDPIKGPALRARRATSRKETRSTPEYREQEARLKRERWAIDIHFRLKGCLRTRLYSAIKDDIKSGSSVFDLGCSVEELVSHLESKFQDGMTWENWGTGYGRWNIDHIMPLSLFNLEDRQHMLLASNYLNLQPLWFEENMRKGNKYPDLAVFSDSEMMGA